MNSCGQVTIAGWIEMDSSSGLDTINNIPLGAIIYGN